MSTQTIRAVVAVDGGVDRELVQSSLPQGEGVHYVGALDVYDGSWSMLEDTQADVVLVACQDGSEHVPAFIAGSLEQRASRPVVVLVTGSPNGYVKRIFESGADDIVTLDGPVSAEPVLFAMQKAVARRSGSRASQGSGNVEVICVLGPKGGIGKTLTACNLAIGLAQHGGRVSLVDLDLQFGDVALAMGLSPAKTMFDLAKSGGSVDPGKLDTYLADHRTGVRALLAPARPEQAQAIGTDLLRQVYGVLEGMSDLVVIDTPPTFSAEVLQALDVSTELCMVGTLDALSLKNTKLGLETLERMGHDPSRVRLVLNRADSRVGITADDVAAILGRQPDVLIPSHRDIAVSVNEGEPIIASHPRSEAAKAFIALAAGYAPHAEGAAGRADHARPDLASRLRLRRVRAA